MCSKNFVFPSILHVIWYDIVTFLCITFDVLQMHLIVTDGSPTLTSDFIILFFAVHALHYFRFNVIKKLAFIRWLSFVREFSGRRLWTSAVGSYIRIAHYLQCDFCFDLFFSFSFSFRFGSYFLILVFRTSFTKTCWRRLVDDLPKYRPQLVTDSLPYGSITRKRCIVC